MKTKFFASAIAMICLSASAIAQSTATASTTAELVAPISITRGTDMNFGIVAASSTPGTVELDYFNGRTAFDGVSLPAGSITQRTAEFAVTGEFNNGFSIALPTSAITLSGSVAGTLTVSDFDSDLAASVFLNDCSQTIMVKAILNVTANAVAGTYSNASDLFVTVNYN